MTEEFDFQLIVDFGIHLEVIFYRFLELEIKGTKRNRESENTKTIHIVSDSEEFPEYTKLAITKVVRS